MKDVDGRDKPGHNAHIRLDLSGQALDAPPSRSVTADGSFDNAVAVLDHPDAQQRGFRGAAVLAVVRLLLDLWPDADSQPGARRILHAGRLFRLFAARTWDQFLAGGTPGRTR